ncbi:MAG: hypothetical protein EOO27_22100 [Comamonadaceae bacterium]|nr:MAG: hypothetical protein EOO27_22100 [Comamonadaceae bacterium]
MTTAVVIGLTVFVSVPAGAETSKAPDGQVIVLEGELADAAGSAPASTDIGDVTLFAWPAEEVLAAAGVGEAVKLTPIAHADVTGDGQFSFTIPEGVDLSRFAGGTDHVNVSMAGVADGEEYWYSSVINASPSASDLEPLSESPVPQVEIESVGTNNSTASKVDTYSDKACYTSTQATFASKSAQVGYTSNARSGGSAQLKFTSGSSGKFGVGVSATGAYGSFSASGTVTLTSSVTITYPKTTTGARAHHAYLVPKKYKIYCESNAGVPISTKYEVRPSNYTGGSSTTSATTFATNRYCTPVGKKTTTTIDESTASTFSSGFKTAGVIGVDLSAQAGYTKQTSLVFKTTTSAGSLCGEKGYPGGAPGRVKLK